MTEAAISERTIATDKIDQNTPDVPTPRDNNDYHAATGSGGKTADKHLPPEPIIPGVTKQEKIDIDGTQRDYSIHAPKDWDGKTPLPVMYFFNGVSPANPEDTFTGLADKADKNGFLLVDIKGAGPMHSFNNGQGALRRRTRTRTNFSIRFINN